MTTTTVYTENLTVPIEAVGPITLDMIVGPQAAGDWRNSIDNRPYGTTP